jgi:hypothetical protein
MRIEFLRHLLCDSMDRQKPIRTFRFDLTIGKQLTLPQDYRKFVVQIMRQQAAIVVDFVRNIAETTHDHSSFPTASKFVPEPHSSM